MGVQVAVSREEEVVKESKVPLQTGEKCFCMPLVICDARPTSTSSESKARVKLLCRKENIDVPHHHRLR